MPTTGRSDDSKGFFLSIFRRTHHAELAGHSGRRPTDFRPGVDPLEGRLVLSTVVHNPVYDTYRYQPLNGDTTYDINGQLASNGGGVLTPHAVNSYGAYLSKGDTLGITAAADGVHAYQVVVSGPAGVVYADGGRRPITGVVDVRLSGVYTVSIRAVDSSTRSAYAQNYTIGLVGTDLPRLAVVPADSTGSFHIAATGQMPTIPFQLTGLAPDPIPANTSLNDFTMTYQITYDARTSPHGPNRQYAYSPNVRYIYDFAAPSYPIPFSGSAHGGVLTITVTPQLPGVNRPLTVSNVRIDATNPTPTMVRNYLLAMTPDPAWPVQSSYSYYAIARKIINHESGIKQFTAAGQPFWSTNGDGGDGLMQLTNPKPTYEAIWDWRQNLNLGLSSNYLSGKIATAKSRLNTLESSVQAEAAKSGGKAAPITPDMIALETIRGFNGYNNNLGLIDEWRPVRDAHGKLVLNRGVTSWERVPVSARYDPAKTISGVPDYVNLVLGTPDF